MSFTLRWFNLALRALMEFGIILAPGSWGYVTAYSTTTRILIATGMPLPGFGLRGLVDFRRAGSLAEPLRLIQELIISGLAAVAWYTPGAQARGWVLDLLSIVHHALVYPLGDNSLKR